MGPDFLAIGVQKSGTTSMIHHFNQHPEIFMLNKEVHFFDKNSLTEENIEKYNNLFITDKVIKGEKTPIYCYDRQAIDRIYEYNPNIKLIMILREPIQRAHSHWNMDQKAKSNVKTKGIPMIERIQREEKYLYTDFTDPHDMTKRGFYIDQIEYILTKFPKENLYIGIAEKIKQNPMEEYNEIFSFLGVSRIDNLNVDIKIHSYQYDADIDYDVCLRLYKIYKEYNERLYHFLGFRIEEWETYYENKNLDIIKN